MSSLTAAERAKIERLLRMGSGYVSNFSDASIETFVTEAVDLDFHSDKYSANGGSKAKKLRELWRIEPDAIVAELLEALIERAKDHEEDKQLVEFCKLVVARLRAAGPSLQGLKMQAATFDAPHLAKAIARLEKHLYADPELAIGSAKELIETCCKTILSERGIEVSANDDLPKLTKATFACLDLLPEGVANERRGSDAIKNVLRSFSTITQGIAELRNLYGTGHGRHGKQPSIGSRHAKLAVGAAATLATFLFETHSAKKVSE